MKKHVPLAGFLLAVSITPAVLLIGTTGYERRAAAALGQGDSAQADADVEIAARLSPWRDDLWERAASLALSGGDARRALELMSNVPRPSPEGFLIAGSAYLQLGDSDAALRQYQAALSEYGEDARVHAGLASVHRARGESDLELAELEGQIRLDPNSAPALYRIGLLTYVASPADAVVQFSQAAEIDAAFRPAVTTLQSAARLASNQPDGAARLITLGRGLGLVGQWDLARDAFEAATTSNPESGEAWAWLAEARQQLGLEAGLELERAVSLAANSATVRGLRGLYWQRMGGPEQALIEFRIAASREPDNAMWQASIGEALAASGDLAAALAAYQRATEIAPTDPNIWRLLSAFCAANAFFIEEVGLPAALRAAELAPADPAVQAMLGWTYLLTGRFALAEKTLLSVLEAEPSNSQARLHLAMTYAAVGRVPEAREQLQTILRTEPTSPTAEQAGQLLGQLAEGS